MALTDWLRIRQMQGMLPAAFGGAPPVERPEQVTIGSPGAPFAMAPPGPVGYSPMSPAGASHTAPILGGSPLMDRLAAAASSAQPQYGDNMSQFQQMLSMLGSMGGGGQLGPAPAVPSNQQQGLGNMGLAQILGSAGAAIAEPGTWQARLGAAGAATAGNLQQREDTLAQQARQEQIAKAGLANQTEGQQLDKVRLAAALQEQYKPFDQQVTEAERMALAKNPWLKVGANQQVFAQNPTAASAITGEPDVVGPTISSRGSTQLYENAEGTATYTFDDVTKMRAAGQDPGKLYKVGTRGKDGAESKKKMQVLSVNQGLWNMEEDKWEVEPKAPNRDPSQWTREQANMHAVDKAIADASKSLERTEVRKEGGKKGFFFADQAEKVKYEAYLRKINYPQAAEAAKRGEIYEPDIPSIDSWRMRQSTIDNTPALPAEEAPAETPMDSLLKKLGLM